MVGAKTGVKGPHPLQKHWVSPRLKMAQSRKGRQRLKTFLPLDKAGKKPLLLLAKIRSRCWPHQIFGVIALGLLIVGTIHSLSSAANMALAWWESELARGLGIPASSSPPSLVPLFASASSSLPSLGTSWCFCFFFYLFSPSIKRGHPDTFSRHKSRILKDLSFPCVFFLFAFLFAFVVSFWYRLA